MTAEIVTPADPRLGLYWRAEAIGYEQVFDGPLLLVVGPKTNAVNNSQTG